MHSVPCVRVGGVEYWAISAAPGSAVSDNIAITSCHNCAMTSSIGAMPTPSTYTRILLQRLPEQAVALLADTGLTLDSVLRAPTITVVQQLQVLRNVKAAAKRDDWALDFGRQLDINAHGPLGFAALSAPTLGEGMAVLTQFAPIRGPNFAYQLRHIGDRLFLEIDTSGWPQDDLAPWLIEILLQVITSYFEAVIGPRVAEATLTFKTPPPPHADAYEKYFLPRCEFNAPANGFSLDASLGSLPCPLYDEKSYRALLIRCREALDVLKHPGDMVSRVQNLLSSHFDQLVAGAEGEHRSLPRQQDMASKLCVSPRTLIRQLAAKGTSFRQLLEQEQSALACKLLQQAQHSVSEIGVLLGYSDVTNFDRAFRRLHGMSPSKFRGMGE